MRHTSAGKVVLAVLLLSGCGQSKQTQTAQTNDKATPFVGGRDRTGDTVQQAYDDADLGPVRLRHISSSTLASPSPRHMDGNIAWGGTVLEQGVAYPAWQT